MSSVVSHGIDKVKISKKNAVVAIRPKSSTVTISTMRPVLPSKTTWTLPKMKASGSKSLPKLGTWQMRMDRI